MTPTEISEGAVAMLLAGFNVMKRCFEIDCGSLAAKLFDCEDK